MMASWLLCATALLSLRASAAPTAAQDDVSQWTNGTAFATAVTAMTNLYRRQHGANDLRWNPFLADFASRYLGSSNCVFQHSGGPYGENIAHGYATPNISVQVWGDERAIYNWSHPGYSPATGHFTQLVWKSSVYVGCARRSCGNSMGWFIACEYFPRGNILGQFQDNLAEVWFLRDL